MPEPVASPLVLDPALFNYDQAIDWDQRWRTEGPMLLATLRDGPSQRVVDLGSSTGETSLWLATHGFTVVGIEGVKRRWEQAVAQTRPEVEFLIGDLGAVEAMVRGHFGAALCLGNTLPALLGIESLARMLIGLRRRLLPGAPLVLQLENYARLKSLGAVALPARRIATDEGDLIFLRLLDLRDDGVVDSTETVLCHRPMADPPVELVSSRPVFEQAWTLDQIETVLEIAQFRNVQAFGGFHGEEFESERSPQLVIVAR